MNQVLEQNIETGIKQGKKQLSEFKKFALKGNIVDMAIGVVIGTGFSKIVNSFVNDIIMPILSLLTKKIDFINMFISLDGVKYPTLEAAKQAGASTINYGVFITTVTDFIITALCIFIVIKQIQKIKEKLYEEEKTIVSFTTKACPHCKKTDVHLEATKCPYCTSIL